MDGRCQNCYCCGKVLSTEKERKKRSRFYGRRLQGVLQALISIVYEVSREVDVEKFKDGFGCKNCIEKLKNFVDRHNDLKSNVCKAIQALSKIPVPSRPISRQRPTSAQTSPVIHLDDGSLALTVCSSY